MQSKLRRHIKAKGSLAQVGYGSPSKVKGLHPSGYQEVMVNTLSDIDNVDPSTQAIRIGRTVGGRKRSLIESKAMDIGIKILNSRGGAEE